MIRAVERVTRGLTQRGSVGARNWRTTENLSRAAPEPRLGLQPRARRADHHPRSRRAPAAERSLRVRAAARFFRGVPRRCCRRPASASPFSAMSIRLLALGLLFLGLTACSGTRDRRVDPDAGDTVTGTGLQSQDIRTMANDMAAKIKASGALAQTREGERATFFVYRMRNDSSDTIDHEIILTKLRTELFEAFGRQVRILDRSEEGNALVEGERALKDRGAVSGTNDRKVAGSDFALKGTIKSRDRQAGRTRNSYILVTFELTDLVTGELVWTGDYDMKTESDRSVINR